MVLTVSFIEYVQIVLFIVDLPTDMTVYPQEYTLHCVKTGHNPYNVEMMFDNAVVANATGCSNSFLCDGSFLWHHDNGTFHHNVSIVWDGLTVSSGSSFQQTSTGDQIFQCIMGVNDQSKYDRTRNVTIKGNVNGYVTNDRNQNY